MIILYHFRPFYQRKVCQDMNSEQPIKGGSKKQETDNNVINQMTASIFSRLNLDIFQNAHFVLFCLNQTLLTFGLSIVYVHLASYAMSIGYSENEGTLLISAMGLSNFLGRIVFGLIGQLPNLTPIAIYTCGILLSGIVVGISPIIQSYVVLVVCSALFGGFTASFGSHTIQVRKTIKIMRISTV